MCNLCGGLLTFIGKLGKLFHYKCRNCGMEASYDEAIHDDLYDDYDDDLDDDDKREYDDYFYDDDDDEY